MSTDRVELYDDHGQEYRWRRVAANGNVVSDCGEGYTRREKALMAALKRNLDVRHERFLDYTRGRAGVPIVSPWVERLLGPKGA